MSDVLDPSVPTTDGAATGDAMHEPIRRNWHDDDGRYIDEILYPNPNDGLTLPPDPKLLVTDGQQKPRDRVTRMIGRAIRMLAGDDPIQFFPADPHRVDARLVFGITSAASTLYDVTAPAAGADFTYTVPAGVYGTLQAVTATLATDANAATRHPILQVTRGGKNIALVPNGNFGTISSSASYGWMVGGVATGGTTTTVGAALPPINVQPGDIIKSTQSGLQVGDQFSAVEILLQGSVDNPNAVVRVGSEKSDVQSGACIEVPINQPFSLTGNATPHTGSIWVQVPTTTAQQVTQYGGVNISVLSVTE